MLKPFPYIETYEELLGSFSLKDYFLNIDPSGVLFLCLITFLISFIFFLAAVLLSLPFDGMAKKSFILVSIIISILSGLVVASLLCAAETFGEKAYAVTQESLQEWIDDTYGLSFTLEQLSELAPEMVATGEPVPPMYVDGVYHALKLVPGGLILQQAALKDAKPLSPESVTPPTTSKERTHERP